MARAGRRPEQPDKQQSRLGPDDWARAALSAIAESGVAGLSVEPLARRLGVTKGSFYWHFATRDAVLEAALTLWEDEGTTEVIAILERLPTAAERLRMLMHLAFAEEEGGRLLLALSAASDDPRIKTVLERVTERRLDYLIRLFRELGQPRPIAVRSAMRAYAEYVGLYQITGAAPRRRLSPGERSRLVEDLVATLVT
jgi:AcrR family transcriptional regulator